MGNCAIQTLVAEMDLETRVQTQDETVCILHGANTLGKGTNWIIQLPSMDE